MRKSRLQNPKNELHKSKRQRVDEYKQNKRTREAFLARLASIKSLAELKEWEKLKLLEDLKGTDFTFPSILASTRDEGSESQWSVLEYSHPDVWSFINRALDEEEVPLQPLAEHDRTSLKVDLKTGKVFFLYGNEALREEILNALNQTLRQGSFPFRRCLVCRTIFIPVKRQKYCSPMCITQGTELARKDKRREYMREYMAKKRQEGKLQTGRKPPAVTIRGTLTGKAEKR